MRVLSVAFIATVGWAAPPLSPFPTDAQCAGLGPATPSLPFAPGERLTYAIDSIGIKAGTLEMLVLPPRPDGKWAVEVKAQTNTFFSKIRSVSSTIVSVFDPTTVRPLQYKEDSTEDEIRRVSDVKFTGPKVALVEVHGFGAPSWRGEMAYGNDVTDIALGFYLMRSVKLQPGQAVCTDVYAVQRFWRVWGKVVGVEKVILPAGEFSSLRVAGQAARHDLRDARREVQLWLSNDERRIPLAALSAIDLGAVRASLTKFVDSPAPSHRKRTGQ